VRLLTRYVLLVGGLIGWVVTATYVLNRNEPVAVLFVVLSVAAYGRRRWRIPGAIERDDHGVKVVGNGTPTVVEFYADL
jgi:hypothetical protein